MPLLPIRFKDRYYACLKVVKRVTNFSMCNVQIYIAKSLLKYLGITLNHTLDSADRITSLINTSSHFQYNIRKSRPFIDFPTAKLLTHSLVLSRLHYCNVTRFVPMRKVYTFLIGTQTSSITKLYRLINRSIRTIYQLKTTDYTTYVTNLRLQLNWLTIYSYNSTN